MKLRSGMRIGIEFDIEVRVWDRGRGLGSRIEVKVEDRDWNLESSGNQG